MRAGGGLNLSRRPMLKEILADRSLLEGTAPWISESRLKFEFAR